MKTYLKENGYLEIINDPDTILNGDESGFLMCPKTGKILAPKGSKNVYCIKSNNEKENIMVLIVFSASGKICPPLIVFPYVRPPRAVVESMPQGWVLGKSESGWMKEDVFYEYVVNAFDEWLNKNHIKRPALLLIDGHKSHMTMALSEACEAKEIMLYALPPNTTHLLQPADVSVFRPLKQEWRKTVRNWQSKPENSNLSVTETNFCRLFKDAFDNTDMVKDIKNGFQKCGLYPFNPNNVDYSKCIQNILEDLQKGKVQVDCSEQVTTEDLNATISSYYQHERHSAKLWN